MTEVPGLEEIRKALQAWTAAEDAYHAAMNEHFAVWWPSDRPSARKLKPLTRDATARLSDLRSELEAREAAYLELCTWD